MSGHRHHCGTELRRQRVLETEVDMGGGALLNGIDFVEVIDSAAPADDMRQRLIDVTFIREDGVATLSVQNFAVTGGVRITGIRVEDVAPTAAANVVRLTLSAAGDFSTYQLALRQGPVNDSPPGNMDRKLSSVFFDFKVECPSDFDCKSPAPVQTARYPGPPIDYLTRDWAGFRKLMLDRMSVTLPNFIERNPADFAVTLVEVLADAADKVSWFQDAIGTEAFFEKSRYRQSLTRHARLLGYRPHEGHNARVAVAVSADQDRSPPAPVIAKGTRFLTAPLQSGSALPAVLPPDPELFETLLARGSVVFEAMEDLPNIRLARNEIRFHTWGEERCFLPLGATSADLIGSPAELGLSAGDLLILEEQIPFGASPDDPPNPAHRQVVRLRSNPVLRFDPVFNVDLSEIYWHAEDALRFELPLDDVAGRPSSVARGNVLLADEGRTIDYALSGAEAKEDEIAVGDASRTGLLPDDGPGTAPRFRLDTESVVRAAPFTPATARTEPASRAFDILEAAVAQVTLTGEGETWNSVADLLASDRFAPEVVVEPGTTPGTAYLRFGDGVLGRAPTDLSAYAARIRHGGGTQGNVGGGAVAHIVSADGAGIAAVDNPLPAVGGDQGEDRRAVHIAAPQAFRTLRRAVTVADYATVAAKHPRVMRAYGRRVWTGSWHTITLAIDLVGGNDIDHAFEADLRSFIESHRLAGHDLDIVSPIFVPLDVVLYLCVAPQFYPRDVESDLLRLFSDQDLVDGSRGLFHPDVLGFGEDVRLSPLIARAMAVPGVSWIGTRDEKGEPVGRFTRMDQSDVDYAEQGAIPIAGGEIARLDNDPSRPEMGRVRFIVEGGR